MKRIIIPWILLLAFSRLGAQNCELETGLPMPPNQTVSYSLEVFDIINDDLSDPGQGVCRVRINFRHAKISNLEMWLQAPNGTEIQLMGPNAIGGTETFPFQLYNVEFVPGAMTPLPDPGNPLRWENSLGLFFSGGALNGSYWPYSGDLEDFNSGPVNGTWQLRVRTDPTTAIIGAANVINAIKIEFCDPLGENCCFAEAGRLTNTTSIRLCEGDPGLQIQPMQSFPGQAPDPEDYNYTWAIGRDTILIAYDTFPDLTTLPPGNYQICGLSFAREDSMNLSLPDGVLRLDSLRRQLTDPLPPFCGMMMDTCLTITIYDIPDTARLNERICGGDTLTVGDSTFFETGEYIIPLQTAQGCDSIVALSLFVDPIPVENLLETICSGDTFEIGNSAYSTTGIYQDTLTNPVTGCDSIINLNLTVLEPIRDTLSVVQCPGPGFTIGDSTFFESGTYEVPLQTFDGCDSIVTLELMVLRPEPVVSGVQDITCTQPIVNLDGSASSPVGQVSFRWEADGGSIIGSGPTLEVTDPGRYFLQIGQTVDTVSCAQRSSPIDIGLDTISPVADIAPPEVLTCQITTLTLDGSGSSSGLGFSYEWTTPDGQIQGPTDQEQAEVTTPGRYTLQVQELANGCTSTASVEVLQDADLPVVDAGMDTAFNCLSNSLLLDGSGSDQGADLDYQWNAVNGSPIINPTTLTPTVTQADIYRLEIFDRQSGCRAADSVWVWPDTTSPVAELLYIDSVLTCGRPAIILRVGPSFSGNPSWLFNGQATGNADTLRAVQAGLYGLIATHPVFSCSDTATVTIGEDFQAPVATTVLPDTLSCIQTSVSISGNGSSSGPDIRYLWTNVNGDTISEDLTTSVSQPGTYFFEVIDLANACSAVAASTVFETAQLPSTRFGNRFFPCEGNSLWLDAFVDPAGEPYAYTWSGADILSRTDSSAVLVGQPGIYQLEVENLRTGCRQSLPAEVVESSCGACFVIDPPDTITCDRPEVELTTTFCENCLACTYSWSTLEGDFSSPIDGPEVVVQAPGRYTLLVVDSSGVPVSQTVEVFADRGIPVADAGPDQVLNCRDTLITLGGSGIPAGPEFQYRWRSLQGGPLADDDQPFVQTEAPGLYELTVLNINNGCLEADTVLVEEDIVVPFVEAGPDQTISCAQPQVNMEGGLSEQGADLQLRWEATEGGNILSGRAGPSPLVGAGGVYRLTVSNVRNYCQATDSAFVEVADALPTIPEIPSRNLNCREESLIFIADIDTLNPALDYQWCQVAIPGDTSACDRGEVQLNVREPGTYLFFVEDTLSGCSNLESITVLQDEEAPRIEAGVDSTLNCNTPALQLNASVAANSNNLRIQWTGNSGQVIINAQSTQPSILEAGTYYLEVENLDNQCLSRDSILIEVDTARPEVFILEERFLSCSQVTTRLSGSSQPPGLQYNWTGPFGGIVADGQTLQPLIQLPGVYQFTAFNPANGCRASVAVEVEDRAIPPQIEVVNTDQLLLGCEVDTLVLDASPSATLNHGPLQYQWTALDGGFIFGNPSRPVIGVREVGRYQVSVFDESTGCADRLTLTVGADFDPPALEIVSSGNLTCNRQVVQLTATGDTVVGFEWVGPDGVPLPLNTPVITVNEPGLYTLTAVDAFTGCRAQAQRTVGFDTLSPIVRITRPENLDCNTSSVVLQATGSSTGPFFSYRWFNALGMELGNGTTLRVAAPGTYILQIIDTRTGCSGMNSVLVEQVTTIIDSVQHLTTPPPCGLESGGRLEVGTVFGGQAPFLYAVDGGTLSTGSQFRNLSTGLHELTIEDANGCQYVEVFEIPVSETIGVELGPDTEIALGDSLQLDPQLFGNPAASFDWQPQDGSIISDSLLALVRPEVTTTYTLTVRDEGGCFASDRVTVFVLEEDLVYIPNAFSPNGDGQNDFFTLFTAPQVEEIGQLLIYDRWGEQVFERSNFAPNIENLGWDGSLRGETMPPGVYLFQAMVVLPNGEEAFFTGSVTLIR